MQQKIEAIHKVVAKGSLREVQALLGKKKLAISKVKVQTLMLFMFGLMDQSLVQSYFLIQ